MYIIANSKINVNRLYKNGYLKLFAGYARVSTESDEQFTSYEAQVDYYTRYIKSNTEWEFVEVYTEM